MNPKTAAIIGAIIGGAATAMSGAALIRNIPGEKTYFVHSLHVDQAHAGSPLVATAYVDVTFTTADGGRATEDIGGVPCPLSASAKTCLQAALNDSATCAKNAP